MNKNLTKENLFELAQKNWYIEHADAKPVYIEMSAAGFTKKLYKSDIPVYSKDLTYFKDAQIDFISLISEHKKIGSFIVKRQMKDKNYMRSLYNSWLDSFILMKKYYYKNFSKNLSILSNEDFKKWMKEFYNFYNNKVQIPGFIDGFMFYSDVRLNDLILKFCKKNNIVEPIKIFNILSAPTEKSFLSEEGYDLYKILKKTKTFKIKKGSQEFEMIQRHIKKYSWIKSSYATYLEYSYKDVLKELKTLAHKRKQNKIKENIKVKKDIINKYKFNNEIIALVRLLEIFVIWQDKRKVYTLTYISLLERVLNELNFRFKIDIEDLRYCKFFELLEIFNDNFDKKEMERRKKMCLVYSSEGEIKEFITDKRGEEFFKKINKNNLEEINELTGIVASLGREKGIVKIVRSLKDLKKVEKGDVLVAAMTRPEFISAIKKASAIITDDGGITCHASIVSRELGIPCIIGTKIATKVLQDGDSVEVDAEKGIVKII